MGTKTIGGQGEPSAAYNGGLLALPGYSTQRWAAGQAPSFTQMNQDGGTTSQTPYNYGAISPADLQAIGWTGGDPYQKVNDNSQIGLATDNTQANAGNGALTPEFQQFLQSKGLTLHVGQGESGYAAQFYDRSGNPVGEGSKFGGGSEGDIFGVSTLLAGGLMGAGAAGLGAGAAEGAAGGTMMPVSAGAASGMTLTPAQIAAYGNVGSSMAGTVGMGGTAAGTTGGLTVGAGTGIGAAGLSAGGAGAGAGTGGLLGGLLPAGVTLKDVATAASLASTVSGAISANRADNAQQTATSTQSQAAQGQLGLAQDQWDYYKNTYLPKSMQLAQDQADLSKQVAQQQMDDATYYRGVSGQLLDQAKKSWEFQDQYMQMARDYSSGKMANTMADEANSDVNQAFGLQRQATQMQMERYGINPGSGAALSLMHDDQNAAALAGAGAQTAARRMARDKAEQMVGIAAGSGQAGFGTGLSAGGLATGAGTQAVSSGASAGTALGQAATGFNQGAVGSGGNFSGGGTSGFRLGQTYNGSPFADFTSGLLNGTTKSGAFGQIGSDLSSYLNGSSGSGSGAPTNYGFGSNVPLGGNGSSSYPSWSGITGSSGEPPPVNYGLSGP